MSGTGTRVAAAGASIANSTGVRPAVMLASKTRSAAVISATTRASPLPAATLTMALAIAATVGADSSPPSITGTSRARRIVA
ncbi:MAG: hypothetical protein BGO26_05455 [Actinobacteria bacterium 69-20]|nr:hypothetical protein [Actinomycetota bacterium]OJV30042.1 MAG: hypothetical protein BGO26_05455 [Actinobacteria bacterium 69-20]